MARQPEQPVQLFATPKRLELIAKCVTAVAEAVLSDDYRLPGNWWQRQKAANDLVEFEESAWNKWRIFSLFHINEPTLLSLDVWQRTIVEDGGRLLIHAPVTPVMPDQAEDRPAIIARPSLDPLERETVRAILGALALPH